MKQRNTGRPGIRMGMGPMLLYYCQEVHVSDYHLKLHSLPSPFLYPPSLFVSQSDFYSPLLAIEEDLEKVIIMKIEGWDSA